MLIVTALFAQAVINIVKRWNSRKEHYEMQPIPQDCQQQQEVAAIVEEEFQREEDFQMWYARRVDLSRIILPEKQARRLYDAYLNNSNTITKQVASEVVE